MYLPQWNSGILEELWHCEVAKHLKDGFDREHAAMRTDALIEYMQKHFPLSLVKGWEAFEHEAGSPDPNDNHVIATAIAGGASAIITEDKNGFPREVQERGIEIIKIQDFLYATVEINPWLALEALQKVQERRVKHNPKLTVSGILEILELRYSLIEAVRVLRMAYSTRR
jgi:predicted nucleic acid-binding protein